MRESCDRPGCVGVAVVAFSLDGVSRVVHLDAVGTGSGDTPEATGLLCERHTARFSAPMGWAIDDRRPPTVAAAPSDPPAPPAGTGSRRAVAPGGSVDQPALDFGGRADVPVEDREGVPESDPEVDGRSAADEPVTRPAVDDFESLLDADSPLLARAFRTARPS